LIYRNPSFLQGIDTFNSLKSEKTFVFFTYKRRIYMSRNIILVSILMLSSFGSYSQLQTPHARHAILTFFRMKGTPPDMRLIRNSPLFSYIPYSTQSFWTGAEYLSYSENGRIRTIHLIDASGVLRDTRSSISLHRHSRWRIQFSAQRRRPLITYRIN
jgi:hypothetical protein